ncbi:hypothetical protein HKX48_002805 [Thoreauomyces humboldtii]|nr:hypothetical protein HKX48_002805 [Thoreauomyces humboldtii]
MISATILRFAVAAAVTVSVAIAAPAPSWNLGICDCNNSFEDDGHCYCDADGLAIKTCIYTPYPNWPLYPAVLPASAPCPDPASDASGYTKCIEDKQQQAIPNASAIAEACVISTHAKYIW